MRHIYIFFHYILNILFPKSPIVTTLEHISVAEASTLLRPHSKRQPTPQLTSLFCYKDSYIQTAMWEIKYRKNMIIADLFAHLLAARIQKDAHLFTSPTYLIPIPLSKERLASRGYNQCQLLIEAMPLPYQKRYDILHRNRHTPPQTHLSRKERLSNLVGCFSVTNTSDIQGSTCIVIDDVSTTGATLQEAAQTLYAAGAKKVYMYSVAG